MKRTALLAAVAAACGFGGCDCLPKGLHAPGYYPAYPPASAEVVECGEADERDGQGEYRKLKGKVLRMQHREQEVMDRIRCARLQITERDAYLGREIWPPGTTVRVLDVQRISVLRKNGIDVADGKPDPRVYEASYLVLELEALETGRRKLWIRDLADKGIFLKDWRTEVEVNFAPAGGAAGGRR